MRMNLFFHAVFLLIGTTLGAGVFALPYVFSRSGWLPSLLGIIILGTIMIVLNLFYSLIILRTDGDHQLPGYVKKYLGKKAANLSLWAMLLALNGALLAYVILGGEFLALSLGRLAGNFYRFWFCLLGFWLFWRGFKSLAKINTWLTAVLVLLMIVIPTSLVRFIRPENYILITKTPLFFWGAALFSLTSFSVIPEIEEVLRRQKYLLRPVVLAGGLLSILLYLVFGFSVWGVTGAVTTVDAFSGLVSFSPALIRWGAAMGLLALFTSFLSLANVVKEIYFRDLKLKQKWARFLAILPAGIGIFLPMGNFVGIISFISATGLVISGVLICLIFAKLKPKFKWFAWAAGLIFVLGAAAEIF